MERMEGRIVLLDHLMSIVTRVPVKIHHLLVTVTGQCTHAVLYNLYDDFWIML